MFYANDESDKQIRKKNFLLTVYVLPATLALAICGILYYASVNNFISSLDRNYGYVFSLSIAFFVFAYNKRQWLTMPDGTYYNLKGNTPAKKINLHEPAEYEEEFFYSKKQQAASAVAGLVMVGMAVFLVISGGKIKAGKTVLIPIVTGAGGLVLAYKGITGLLDKTPKLKLAKTGLWTNKLGFVDWNDITKAVVVANQAGQSKQTILEIYLKNTVFAEADKPDESLNLTEVNNNQYVEMVIDNLMGKRNELPK